MKLELTNIQDTSAKYWSDGGLMTGGVVGVVGVEEVGGNVE